MPVLFLPFMVHICTWIYKETYILWMNLNICVYFVESLYCTRHIVNSKIENNCSGLFAVYAIKCNTELDMYIYIFHIQIKMNIQPEKYARCWNPMGIRVYTRRRAVSLTAGAMCCY